MSNMINRLSCVAAALIVSVVVVTSSSRAALFNVDFNVVDAMKELRNMVSSLWSTWDAYQQKNVSAAIPRVAYDLTKLASQKRVVANDIRELIADHQTLNTSANQSHLDAMLHNNKTFSDFTSKVNEDAQKLNVTLSDLKKQVDRIDPNWSYKHFNVQKNIFGVAEGYGSVILKVGEFTSELNAQSININQMNDMVNYLDNEANKLDNVAQSLSEIAH